MSAGRACGRGSRRASLRQRQRPHADEAGRAHRRRAHHGGRPRGSGADSAGRAGDRSQPGDRAARTHRCPHAHVQHASGGHEHRAIDARRHSESAGRSPCRHDHGAGHELARQRLRRCRDSQRDHDGRPRRTAFPGLRPRHPLGSESAEGPRESARLSDDSLRRRRARRGARASREGRGLDQAVSDRCLLVQSDRRGAVRADVSVAGAASDHRRGASTEQENGVPRVRRRRPAVRDHRWMRQHRTRLRPQPGAAHRDVEEGSLLRSDLDAVHRAVHGRQRREEHGRQVPYDADLRERGVDGGEDARVEDHGR